MTRHIDDLGDTRHRIIQNVIGVTEPFEHAVVFVDLFQLFVEDDDQRIDMLAEFFQTLICDIQTFLTFVAEWLGNHGNGQCTQLLGNFSHHGRCTSTGTTTHTSGDEHHVRTTQCIFDTVTGFFGQLTSNRWLHTGAESGLANLNHVMRF